MPRITRRPVADRTRLKLPARDDWIGKIKPGGKYFVTRNGSTLVAFNVGKAYKPGNGVAMIAGHIDALTTRLKPVSNKPSKAGYVQLGVAPYAGALNPTWWDRDLSIGGRVVVRDGESGKTATRLVKLDWPSTFSEAPMPFLILWISRLTAIHSRKNSHLGTAFWNWHHGYQQQGDPGGADNRPR
jgi:hypothetical protein